MKKTIKTICLIAILFVMPFLSNAAISGNEKFQNDTTALKEQAKQAKKQGDTASMNLAIKSYLEELNGKYSKENFNFLISYATSTRSESFQFYFKNQDLINKISGNLLGSRLVEQVIRLEYLKLNPKADPKAPDWTLLEEKVKPFGAAGQFELLRVKWDYYFKVKDWKNFVYKFKEFTEKYPSRVDKSRGNDDLYDLYNECSDKELLKIAAGIQKKILDAETQKLFIGNYMDTYACLLYRSGQQAKAIEWEQKTVDYYKALKSDEYDPNNLKEVESVVEKMKAGLPTWQQ